MKKFLTSTLIICSLLVIGCSSDDDAPTPTPPPTTTPPPTETPDPEATCSDGIQNGGETGVDCGGTCPNLCVGSTIVVSEDISEDTTWSSDYMYELEGRIYVNDGATLTIEPGVIIKAQPGTGASASVLICGIGGTLVADGEPDAPIIFTSVADNIEYGSTAGTDLDENQRGLWGGVIVLGRATSSFDGDVAQVQIEGIPASDTRGLYGGNIPDDNQGTILDYVSIRHGGALIGEGNEINGLTLGGVGTGATISNIEVVANVDDGIEFFGGTVNATNLFVWSCGDDGIDLDQAYSGTIDNAMVVQGGNSDHALEIDGPEGSIQGAFTLTNVTLVGLPNNAADGEIADFRDGAQGTVSNVFVTGFTGIGTGLQFSDVELDNAGVAANYTAGDLVFENWEIVLPAGVTNVSEIFDDTSDTSTFSADAATFASPVTTGTVGADTSVFAWTYSNFKAELGF